MERSLKLVQCTEEYWEFVRILRTDPRNIDGFIEHNDITVEDQKKYMEKYWKNYWICIDDTGPLGYIGEINGDIRVCADHDVKGQGISKFMVKELLKLRPNVYAKVKIENIPSQKLFESVGFKLVEIVDYKGKLNESFKYYKP